MNNELDELDELDLIEIQAVLERRSKMRKWKYMTLPRECGKCGHVFDASIPHNEGYKVCVECRGPRWRMNDSYTYITKCAGSKITTGFNMIREGGYDE